MAFIVKTCAQCVDIISRFGYASVLEAPMARISSTLRSDNINIRVTPETLGLIDRAARVAGKTRTDFIAGFNARLIVRLSTNESLGHDHAADNHPQKCHH